jgi:hypothetical protein
MPGPGGPHHAGLVNATRTQDLQQLPGTPWAIRAASGSRGRIALEVYAAGTLMDVMVAQSLAPRLLRGARSAVWAGQPCAVAWGCLPADGAGVAVTFGRGRVRPRRNAVEVTTIAGWFWIALADRRASSVTVTSCGIAERCRTRTVRPC